MIIGKNGFDVDALLNNAVSPEIWKNHVVHDLMKFWDKPEITNMKDGLFPTYVTNDGRVIPEDEPSPEYDAASQSEDTKGLVDRGNNYIRAHSRLTYAFGIAFHMTGNKHYLDICRKGALALLEAFDGNYGMHVTKSIKCGQFDKDYKLRTSQDLAYGLTGLGMYYFLTRDKTVLYRIIQLKDFIFNVYMDDARGYLTWKPRYLKDPEVQIVAQLDQLYAYMLMITPVLPEPFKSQWKKDMKKIVDILITQFYSERYKFFWGVDSDAHSMQLGTDHTDFGHSVKTFWVILKVGELIGEPFYIQFARENIDKILRNAYLEENGSWARRFVSDNVLDKDKEWWILAELDQAAEILAIHDPTYYEYLNNTHKYWFDYMVDKVNGEIWHYVDGATNKPLEKYPKAHNWKTSLHSFEHALFGFMTASKAKSETFDLYYALPEWEKPNKCIITPYMFAADLLGAVPIERPDFMPDNNQIFKVTFDSLH